MANARYLVTTFTFANDDEETPTTLVDRRGIDCQRELVEYLISIGAAAPAAREMDVADVIHRVNNVNGGELIVVVN